MPVNDTLAFLQDLAHHNDREWFEAHRTDYAKARGGAEALVDAVIGRLSRTDADIEGQVAAKCLFRIHRDVRFSRNKAPYKTHFGAFLARGGRKSVHAGYYLHIEPGASFAAAGLWMPEADALARIRQEIDYGFDEFQALLAAEAFRSRFGDLQQQADVSLSRMPRGYAPDHPAARYLKLKSFIASCPLPDARVQAPDAATEIADAFSASTPFIRFLNRTFDA
jgi:uncharacterized protein (TIGR02453 family)